MYIYIYMYIICLHITEVLSRSSARAQAEGLQHAAPVQKARSAGKKGYVSMYAFMYIIIYIYIYICRFTFVMS